MTKFKKGESGNPNGRPPGQSEKVKELRQRLLDLIDANFETLQTEFEKLKGKDKILVLDRLLRHCLPPPPNEDILTGMSDNDLDLLILYLQKKLNEKG